MGNLPPISDASVKGGAVQAGQPRLVYSIEKALPTAACMAG
jgi:hypothetical protein